MNIDQRCRNLCKRRTTHTGNGRVCVRCTKKRRSSRVSRILSVSPLFSPSIKLSQVGLGTLDNCRRYVQNFSPTAHTPNSPYFSDEKDFFFFADQKPAPEFMGVHCVFARSLFMNGTANDSERRGGGKRGGEEESSLLSNPRFPKLATDPQRI